MRQAFLQQIPAVSELFEGADVIDIKTIEASATLREFIAGFAGYRPALVYWLFGIRNLFARLLGLSAEKLQQPTQPRPQDVPMTPGAQMLFTVKKAEEDHYWIAGESDSHLDFAVAIVVEPLGESVNRFYVVTYVYYHKTIGHLYFMVIAPFHHLLVNLFMHAAVKTVRQRHKVETRAA